jgi:type IV secretory pathway TrbL component
MRKSMHNCEKICYGSEAVRPDDQLREGRQRVRVTKPPAARSGTARRPGWAQAGAGLARDMDKAKRKFCATEQALAQVSEGESTLSAYFGNFAVRQAPRVRMSRRWSRSPRTEVEGR